MTFGLFAIGGLAMLVCIRWFVVGVVCLSGVTYAQNKVVVIPLGSDSSIPPVQQRKVSILGSSFLPAAGSEDTFKRSATGYIYNLGGTATATAQVPIPSPATITTMTCYAANSAADAFTITINPQVRQSGSFDAGNYANLSLTPTAGTTDISSVTNDQTIPIREGDFNYVRIGMSGTSTSTFQRRFFGCEISYEFELDK